MRLRPARPFVRRSRRAGITLLELLLALGLTGVIMVVISMAIDLHLRTLDVQRTSVEEAQLARAVLRHIAADLRCAVWYEPIDMSGVQLAVAPTDLGTTTEDGAADNSGQANNGQTNTETPQGETPGGETTPEGGDTGMDSTGMESLDTSGLDLEGETSENTTDIAGTVEPTSTPGLFGNQYEIRVDVSRLPRVDQYQPTAGDSAAVAGVTIPSDVKTVAYFLQGEDQAATSAAGTTGLLGARGLVRRELDRAVASYASGNGELSADDCPGEVIAPEVSYLEFRYFDGSEWYSEWDSEEMGTLPVAVEVTICVDPTGGADPATLDVTEATNAAQADIAEFTYRLVVHLPVSQALTSTAGDDTMTDETTEESER